VPEKCQVARTRWDQYRAFSRFLGGFLEKLSAIYDRSDLTPEEKVEARSALHTATRSEYTSLPNERGELDIVLRFLEAPLNNAILLSRILYFHRLDDFQALLDRHEGDLPSAIEALRAGVPHVEDPLLLLPSGPS
jgi:predicted aminopeptidase